MRSYRQLPVLKPKWPQAYIAWLLVQFKQLWMRVLAREQNFLFFVLYQAVIHVYFSFKHNSLKIDSLLKPIDEKQFLALPRWLHFSAPVWISQYKILLSIIGWPSTNLVHLQRTAASRGSLNNIHFPFFSTHYTAIHVCPHAVGLHSDVENMRLSCCGSTWLIYTVVLNKWEHSCLFFCSLRTSV